MNNKNRCHGITQNGERCKRNASNHISNGKKQQKHKYCRSHDPSCQKKRQDYKNDCRDVRECNAAMSNALLRHIAIQADKCAKGRTNFKHDCCTGTNAGHEYQIERSRRIRRDCELLLGSHINSRNGYK